MGPADGADGRMGAMPSGSTGGTENPAICSKVLCEAKCVDFKGDTPESIVQNRVEAEAVLVTDKDVPTSVYFGQ